MHKKSTKKVFESNEAEDWQEHKNYAATLYEGPLCYEFILHHMKKAKSVSFRVR